MGTEQQWCQLGWGGLEQCWPAAEALHSTDLPGVVQHGSSLGMLWALIYKILPQIEAQGFIFK